MFPDNDGETIVEGTPIGQCEFLRLSRRCPAFFFLSPYVVALCLQYSHVLGISVLKFVLVDCKSWTSSPKSIQFKLTFVKGKGWRIQHVKSKLYLRKTKARFPERSVGSFELSKNRASYWNIVRFIFFAGHLGCFVNKFPSSSLQADRSSLH